MTIASKIIRLHEGQMEVFRSQARFRVIAAGRRWGKSLCALAIMISRLKKQNQRVWYIAPTYQMARQIMWEEVKKVMPPQYVKKVNETFMTMRLINGSELALKGSDKGDTLRGVGLNFVVMDEVQDMKPEVWTQIIRPTLSSTGGSALFTGSPKAFNLLWDLYQLGQDPRKKQWDSWQFPTRTSPFIPESEIEQAREDLDPRSFRQEYEACHLPGTMVRLWDGTLKPISDVLPGDILPHLANDGTVQPCEVEAAGPTGIKPILKVTLETGEMFSASVHHRMKVRGAEVRLEDAIQLEASPEVGMSEAEVWMWLEMQYLAARDRSAGGDFQDFQQWLSERWDRQRRTLRLNIVSRMECAPTQVYNIRVNSHDHSYLLANGLNNFNSFEHMSGRVYYTFDRRIHTQPCPFNRDLPIWVGQDFNIDPMSSVIMQPQLNGDVWVVDEIVLQNSNTAEVCNEIERRLWRYKSLVTIYPDPSGAGRSTARGESDLDIFRERGFNNIKHRRKAPNLSDRFNAVNRMLMSASGKVSLRIDPSCKHLIESLDQTIYKDGSRDVNKLLGKEHSADALGYAIEFEFPFRDRPLIGLNI